MKYNSFCCKVFQISMKRVGLMNALKAQIEEVILQELIFQ